MPRMAEKEDKMKELAKEEQATCTCEYIYIYIYICVVQTSFLNDMSGGGWNPSQISPFVLNSSRKY